MGGELLKSDVEVHQWIVRDPLRVTDFVEHPLPSRIGGVRLCLSGLGGGPIGTCCYVGAL